MIAFAFWQQFKEIVIREFKLILNDSRLRSVVLIAPIIYGILMSAVYWHDTVDEVSIAVVQNDHSQLARNLSRLLDASPKLKVLQNTHHITEAERALMEGSVAGIVVIEEDFSSRIKTGKESRVVAIVDASNLLLANTISNAVLSVTQTISAGVSVEKLKLRGLTHNQALATAMPIRTELRPLFNPQFSYNKFMLPGLLMTVLQQVMLLGLALSWSGERETTSIKSLLSLSSRPWILLSAKAVPYLLIHGLVCGLFIGLFFPASGLNMEGSWLLLIIYTVLFLFAIVTWGMWISIWLPNRLFATQVLMFLAMPSFLLSGYTWPQSAMPEILQKISQLLPLTHFIVGLRRICLGGSDLEMLGTSMIILIAFSLVHISLAWLGIKLLLKRNAMSQSAKSHDLQELQLNP